MNNFLVNKKKRAIDESLKTTPDATPDCRPRPILLCILNGTWSCLILNGSEVCTLHTLPQITPKVNFKIPNCKK